MPSTSPSPQRFRRGSLAVVAILTLLIIAVCFYAWTRKELFFHDFYIR